MDELASAMGAADGDWDMGAILELLPPAPATEDALLAALLPPAETAPVEIADAAVVRRAIRKQSHAMAPSHNERARTTSRAQTKRTVHELREEEARLTAHLVRLRAERARGGADMEAVMVQRHRRRRAEEHNRELRKATYLQARFITQLRSVFSSAPAYSSDLNLCQFLHSYTRLPKEPARRRAEYQTLANEGRLKMAMELLAAETASVSFLRPHVRTQFSDRADGFSATTIGVYAFDTVDIGRVLRGACVAIRDIAVTWPQCQRVGVSRQIVDLDASSCHNLCYGVVGVKYKSPHCSCDELSVETRTATFYTITGDSAMVMWDFVDEDELYPVKDSTDILRTAIGGCLIRVEVCEDGVERAVCRTICTKRYRRRERLLTKAVEQFLTCALEAPKQNGVVFKDLIREQVEQEEKLMATAFGSLMEHLQ